MQIEEQVSGLGYFTDTSCIAVYGGNDQDGFSRQRAALKNGADVIVSTPGRLMSHLSLGYVNIDNLEFLVLDEADEMLDMGFYDDILSIISYLPKKRQTLMYSATMPVAIRKLASQILVDQVVLDLNFSKPAQEIDQKVYMVYDRDKPQMLSTLLQDFKDQKVIVFAGTKLNVSKISSYLRMVGIKNSAMNSSFTQQERNEKMQDFKNGKIKIFVTTNLLSRGVDIENVNLILNYDIPDKAEDYVHRIGRTARAGKLGLAISFIGEKEIFSFNRIEKLLDREVEKLDNPDGIPKGPEYRIIDTKKNKYYRKGGNKKRNFKKKRPSSK